jgi:hypothetical protein
VLEPLLVRDAEALLLVDDDEPELVERTDLASSACVPITMSIVPSATPSSTLRRSASGTNRLTTPMRTGKPAKRSRNVSACCWARIVVGTRTATCAPSNTAFPAARTATSVFPNPTSPASSRSIGSGASMSRLISSTTVSWSTVSTCWKASSSSRCSSPSGRERAARRVQPRRVEPDELGGELGGRTARTAAGTLPLRTTEPHHGRLVAAAVARQRIDLVRRDEERVAAVVLDDDVVAADRRPSSPSEARVTIPRKIPTPWVRWTTASPSESETTASAARMRVPSGGSRVGVADRRRRWWRAARARATARRPPRAGATRRPRRGPGGRGGSEGEHLGRHGVPPSTSTMRRAGPSASTLTTTRRPSASSARARPASASTSPRSESHGRTSSDLVAGAGERADATHDARRASRRARRAPRAGERDGSRRSGRAAT